LPPCPPILQSSNPELTSLASTTPVNLVPTDGANIAGATTDYEDAPGAGVLPPSPTESGNCVAHGNHWHCDGVKSTAVRGHGTDGTPAGTDSYSGTPPPADTKVGPGKESAPAASGTTGTQSSPSVTESTGHSKTISSASKPTTEVPNDNAGMKLGGGIGIAAALGAAGIFFV